MGHRDQDRLGDRSVSVTALGASLLLPVMMFRHEIITVKQAADLTKRSEKTIRRWCGEHRIARQSAPNAPLEISSLALAMVLQNDLATLERLRDGDRNHPDVQRYVRFLALPTARP